MRESQGPLLPGTTGIFTAPSPCADRTGACAFLFLFVVAAAAAAAAAAVADGTSKTMVKSIPMDGEDIWNVISERTLTVAREYFDCPTLTALPLMGENVLVRHRRRRCRKPRRPLVVHLDSRELRLAWSRGLWCKMVTVAARSCAPSPSLLWCKMVTVTARSCAAPSPSLPIICRAVPAAAATGRIGS